MMKILKLRGVLSLIFMLILSEGITQDFSQHNWYFGNSVRGIRFSRTDNTPSIVSNKVPLGLGGSAVATDQVNANLLFYSDGTQVINMNHQLMTNGGGLMGNNGSNQPAAISPVPSQSSQYYVFTNTASFTTGGIVRFSIVYMILPGGATFPTPPIGAVTKKNDA
jgi:hypothetical protein